MFKQFKHTFEVHITIDKILIRNITLQDCIQKSFLNFRTSNFPNVHKKHQYQIIHVHIYKFHIGC